MIERKIEKLSNEIEEVNKKVATDTLTMSVGEIINSYREKDLIINPKYQRLYRWKDWQKTKFIESILMGLPLPSIFVQQNSNDGKWELVDGLQRISTILEFTGELEGYDKNLKLVECDKITSLENLQYNDFTVDIKRLFRKARISVMVIKSNVKESKYELFSRINSTGSPLTSQEIRNAILCDEKPELFELIKSLSLDENFLESVSISEAEIEQAYDQELVIRFFAYKNFQKIRSKKSMVKYVDYYINNIYNKEEIHTMEKDFKHFFSSINKISHRAFCRKKSGFSIAIYEAIIVGLSEKLNPKYKHNESMLKEKIEAINNQDWLLKFKKRGSNAKERLEIFNSEARNYFSEV